MIQKSIKYSEKRFAPIILKKDKLGKYDDHSHKIIEANSAMRVPNLAGKLFTVGIGDIFFNNLPISDKYNFQEARYHFFESRDPKQGLEGRFSSLEERLNAIEDELAIVSRLADMVAEDSCDMLRNNLLGDIEEISSEVHNTEDRINRRIVNILDKPVEKKEEVNPWLITAVLVTGLITAVSLINRRK